MFFFGIVWKHYDIGKREGKFERNGLRKKQSLLKNKTSDCNNFANKSRATNLLRWQERGVDAESDFSYFMARHEFALESIIDGLRRLDESLHNCRIYCHYDCGGVSLIFCLMVRSPLFQ